MQGLCVSGVVPVTIASAPLVAAIVVAVVVVVVVFVNLSPPSHSSAVFTAFSHRLSASILAPRLYSSPRYTQPS